MVDPIGPRAMPPAQTKALRQSRKNGSTPVVTMVPRETKEESAGFGLGVTAGVDVGSRKTLGAGGSAKAEAGWDSFGGFYQGSGVEGNVRTPIGGANGGSEIRNYPFDETGKFSRSQFEWSGDIGHQSANVGRSDTWTGDQNPLTPEHTGKRWNKLAGKMVERVGADTLERDGPSEGFSLGIMGAETDYRFNPNGLRFESNNYVGAIAYREQDTVGWVTYDPPSGKAIVTDNYGVGIARFAGYVSDLEKHEYDGRWALDVSPDYKGGTPGKLSDIEREDARGSYRQMTVLSGSADFGGNARVLDGLGFKSEDSYLQHIENVVAKSQLPGSVVIARMDRAVRDTAMAMKKDPTKSVADAFGEQPPIDRRNPMEQALSQGTRADTALELALARDNGDLRPNSDILRDIIAKGPSPAAMIADDAIGFETIRSHLTGTPVDFDAVVAAGKARADGDSRSPGALVMDHHDNGKVDGSNVVEASIGEQSYGVTPGGGVVTEPQDDGSTSVTRTTLTPNEYTVRKSSR